MQKAANRPGARPYAGLPAGGEQVVTTQTVEVWRNKVKSEERSKNEWYERWGPSFGLTAPPEPAPSEKRPIRAAKAYPPPHAAPASERIDAGNKYDPATAPTGVGAFQAPERTPSVRSAGSRHLGIVGAANHGKFGSTIWAQAHANVGAASTAGTIEALGAHGSVAREHGQAAGFRGVVQGDLAVGARAFRAPPRPSRAAAEAARRGRARAQGHRAVDLDDDQLGRLARRAAAARGAPDPVVPPEATARPRCSRRARTSRRRRRRSASRGPYPRTAPPSPCPCARTRRSCTRSQAPRSRCLGTPSVARWAGERACTYEIREYAEPMRHELEAARLLCGSAAAATRAALAPLPAAGGLPRPRAAIGAAAAFAPRPRTLGGGGGGGGGACVLGVCSRRRRHADRWPARRLLARRDGRDEGRRRRRGRSPCGRSSSSASRGRGRARPRGTRRAREAASARSRRRCQGARAYRGEEARTSRPSPPTPPTAAAATRAPSRVRPPAAARAQRGHRLLSSSCLLARRAVAAALVVVVGGVVAACRCPPRPRPRPHPPPRAIARELLLRFASAAAASRASLSSSSQSRWPCIRAFSIAVPSSSAASSGQPASSNGWTHLLRPIVAAITRALAPSLRRTSTLAPASTSA